MGVSSVRTTPSAPTSTASTSSASTASKSSGATGIIGQGLQALGSVFGMGGGGESTQDQTKAMIDSFIYSNMQKMREEAEKKLEEAMKKKG